MFCHHLVNYGGDMSIKDNQLEEYQILGFPEIGLREIVEMFYC